MIDSRRPSDSVPLLRVLTAIAVIAALHFGKELVIPVALAILLSFLLTYPATWLERLKLGRALSVAVVLVLAFSAAGAIVWIGGRQFTEIVSSLPHYQQNVHRKLAKIRNPATSGVGKAFESVNQIATEIFARGAAAKSQQSSSGKAHEPIPRGPIPVQIVKEMPDGIESFRLVSTSLAQVAGATLVIAILTLFILLRRNDLRNRLFRLFGEGRINVMTTAIDDAAKRVSQYLLTQSIVNGTFGLLLGVGLLILGVPYAAFWGAAAAAARFIPYVGTIAAGMCPFLLSLAVFDGWTKPLLTLGLFAAVEATTFGVLEPWFYATRTGISSLAILIAAAFWTLLWGPIGLVVSTPLTVLLFVLGRHVPQFQFLYVLLGDEPVLSPEALYYQRLLARDESEARDVAEEYLKDKTLVEFYDSVLIPALSLAEQDRHQNELDETRQRFVYETTRELIEELGEDALTDSKDAKLAASSPFYVLCIPARDYADELASLMLTQVLRLSGFEVEAVAIGLVKEILTNRDNRLPKAIIISAVPPFAVSHLRSLCRKVRERDPGVKLAAGLWGTTDVNAMRRRFGVESPDHFMRTLAEVELQLRLLQGQPLLPDEHSARVSSESDEPEPESVRVD